MAKKKPSKPSRPIATTSIASKPREATDTDPIQHKQHPRPPNNKKDISTGPSTTAATKFAAESSSTATVTGADQGGVVQAATAQPTISPEEFEKLLEESALQLFVEKYAPKVQRDANRQKQRLETERRLLRSQSTPINVLKWLPQGLVDQILDQIQAENRFAATSLSSEGNNNTSAKNISEDETVVRLWTLRQTLLATGFPLERMQPTLRYVLEVAHMMQPPGKDSIWGLDEALTWLASQCALEELPDYDSRARNPSKVLALQPNTTPLSSRPHSPSKRTDPPAQKSIPKKKTVVTCDSDIEPDQLGSEWINAKTKLLALDHAKRDDNTSITTDTNKDDQLNIEFANLQARIQKIENDILFDRVVAEQEWRSQRPIIEKELAHFRKQKAKEAKKEKQPQTQAAQISTNLENEVTMQAEKMAADILSGSSIDDENYDVGLGELFASLPQSEIDPATGKSITSIQTTDGDRIIIRDFGKWSGINPTRVLEEACRSRDNSVRISYSLCSETSFANRHQAIITWTKPQEIPPGPESTQEVDVSAGPNEYRFTMSGIATPDSKQSEAFIATFALFYVFGSSQKEEKVFMRLPAVWREFWTEMSEAKKSAADTKSRNEAKDIKDLVRKKQDQEDEDGVILQGTFKGRNSARGLVDTNDDANHDRYPLAITNPDYFRKIWADKSSTRKFFTMLQGRMKLPMWDFKQQVVEAVENHQIVIICGETGCGKSTQTPAFLLEHQLSQGKHCKIYCTEPRRISALSLARRVSEELGENRGDIGTSRSLVGYAIRLESKTCRETRLVYATTGIVMRMLEGSSDLQEITHLVLDEVHERSIDTDFLLIVLKKLLSKRPDLKVILMSATVDSQRFARYMGDNVPILNVPGRTYPVQVRYLEDVIELTGYKVSDATVERIFDLDLDDDGLDDGSRADPQIDLGRGLGQYSLNTRKTLARLDEYRIDCELIVQLILKMAADSSLSTFSQAILVFLPGIAEIRTLNDMLLGHPFFSRDWLVFALHSTIATEDQEAAFLLPPEGFRKIVLATNIAETGVTIPDVTAVIDTGKHKESRFDERRQISRLVDTFISRANAKQRRGRAGRVQEGICFHLFTKNRHDNLINDQQTPEMLRLSLQDLAIRVKVCGLGGIEETLSDALDPPSAKNIRRAVDALKDVRALTQGEELTPLGKQLARLPLDVFLGKLILFGVIFKCLDMAITVAAIMSSKSPFSAPFGQRAQANNARLSFRRADSDLLTVYNAYQAWKRICQSRDVGGKDAQFCRKNFLNQQTLCNIEDLKGQLLTTLVDSGFLPLTSDERETLSRLRFGHKGRRQQPFFEMPLRVNTNNNNDAITSAVIAWSFYPKLLVRDAPGSKGLRNIGNNQSISLHPTSVNRGRLDIDWLSYYHIMQTKQIYHAHESTAVDVFAITILCGDVRCEMYAGVFILDGNRGKFSVPDWKTMLVIKTLRTRLREMLARSFKQPGKLPTPQHQRWLDLLQRVFAPPDEREVSEP